MYMYNAGPNLFIFLKFYPATCTSMEIFMYKAGSNLLKLINYSYGYKPIGVPNFGQVHVS